MASPQTRAAERRAHPRHPTAWWTELERDTRTLEGVILNVSVGGALVRVAGRETLQVGDNLRLRFRLGDSMRMAVCARVRWVGSSCHELGSREVGVSFYDLIESKRDIILEQARDWDPDRESDVSIEKKILVRGSGAQLWVWLAGSLSTTESARVHALVGAQVADRVDRPLLAYLDIRRLHTCSAQGLESFRRWLRLLGRANPFGALLAGSDSIVLRQVVRLAEEVQLRDAVRVVTQPEQVGIAWRTLEKKVLGVGSAR